MSEAAIAAIEDAQHSLAVGRVDADLFAQAGLHVMTLYRHRIEAVGSRTGNADTDRGLRQIERELFQVGLKAEREEVRRLEAQRRLSSEEAGKLLRETDLMEARIGS